MSKITWFWLSLCPGNRHQKDQTELSILINKLNNYDPRNPNKIEEKQKVLESARKLQNARKDIIDFFEKGIFPDRGNVFKTKEESEESEENKFFEHIENESKATGYALVIYYFDLLRPSDLAKKLFEIKDKKKNKALEIEDNVNLTLVIG